LEKRCTSGKEGRQQRPKVKESGVIVGARLVILLLINLILQDDRVGSKNGNYRTNSLVFSGLFLTNL